MLKVCMVLLIFSFQLSSQNDTNSIQLPEAIFETQEHRHVEFNGIEKLDMLVQTIELSDTEIQSFSSPNISNTLQQIPGVSVHNHGNEGMHISFPASPFAQGQLTWNGHLIQSSREDFNNSAQNLQVWDANLLSNLSLNYFDISSTALSTEVIEITSLNPRTVLVPKIQVNVGSSFPFYLPNSGVSVVSPFKTKQIHHALGVSYSNRNTRTQSTEYAYSPNLSHAIARELYSEFTSRRDLLNLLFASSYKLNQHTFELHQLGQFRRAKNSLQSARFLYQSDQGEVVNLRTQQYQELTRRYQALFSWNYSGNQFQSNTSISTQLEEFKEGGRSPDFSFQTDIYSRVQFQDVQYLDASGNITSDQDEAVSKGKFWDSDLEGGVGSNQLPNYKPLQNQWFFESARSELYSHQHSIPLQIVSSQRWELIPNLVDLQVHQRGLWKVGRFQQEYQQYLTAAGSDLQFPINENTIISRNHQFNYSFFFPNFSQKDFILSNTEQFPFSQSVPFYRQYNALNFSYQDFEYYASLVTNWKLSKALNIQLGLQYTYLNSTIYSDSLVQNPIGSDELYTSIPKESSIISQLLSPILYVQYRTSKRQKLSIYYRENLMLPDYIHRSPGDGFIDYQNLLFFLPQVNLQAIQVKNVHVNYNASLPILRWLEFGVRFKQFNQYPLINQYYGNGVNGRLGYLVSVPEQTESAVILSPHITSKIQLSDIFSNHMFEHLTAEVSGQYNWSQVSGISFRDQRHPMPMLIPFMTQLNIGYEGEAWHFNAGLHYQSQYVQAYSYNVNDDLLVDFRSVIESGVYDSYLNSRTWIQLGVGYHWNSKWSVQANYSGILTAEQGYIGNSNRPYFSQTYPSSVSLNLRYGVFN